MDTRRSISRRVFPVLILLMYVLTGALPVRAEVFIRPLLASGDYLWARSIGGPSEDAGSDIEVDLAGNVYTAGFFDGTVDFDPGSSTTNLTSIGTSDMFVSKLNGNGNLVWAKSTGGAGDEESRSITVDATGNVYTTGGFAGTADFDPGPSTTNLTSVGDFDVFVSKLDSNGNFLWAKRIGGTGSEEGSSITVDSSSNVYTTGSFEGTVDFDPGAGTANLTSMGGADIFISKLDGHGNFAWAKRIGGAVNINGDWPNNIIVDSSSNIYTTGAFEGTVDFDPGAGTANLISAGESDIFVSKLDSNGNFVWAKTMGGVTYEEGIGIVIDLSGNVYTTGIFLGTADFDPGVGTANLISAGESDIFVSKLDSNGNFVWARSLSGTNNEGSIDITVDSSSNVYTTGAFEGTVDFDPGAGTANLISAGSLDIFVSKLDGNGNFVWAKAMSGASFEVSNAITLDLSGNTYTTGLFVGTVDFDPGPSTTNLTSAGGGDIFISKLENIIFADVSSDYWARGFIDRLYAAGITAGCGTNPPRYCPQDSVTRAQMAIFLERGVHGSSYNPPAVGASTGFRDVPTTYWAAAWINQLAGEGIAGGCGSGNYCPEVPVTRAQMAILLLRSKHGASYAPPDVGGSTGFSDVSTGYWAGAWIKQLVAEGITAGCGTGMYCPESPVTRAQMAVFLVRTFNLP